MIVVRSLVWALVFYVWSAIVGLAMVPLLLAPRRWMIHAMSFWGAGVNALIGPICGIKVEFRGLEHAPKGAAIVAAKHLCMYDTIGPFAVLPDFCYVMKKELMWIPFYGWYSAKGRMIVVDREGHSKALRQMMKDAREAAAENRQIIIFPEGHRMDPGDPPDYKPGIAGLYRDLDLPVVPLATTSGVHWPAHGFTRRPGKIVYQFLEPIPPGLHRGEFMRTLQDRLEAASTALLTE
ncbi:MAG TPA: lysophospholipid acyltransferase family protein [Caulobacteraceae bacterium]|nr:lysophospholipid acyltransferase family protein [Caulobacteraceae bacterium]